jgi:hypothetical protein
VRSMQRAVPRSVTPRPIPATFRPSATGGQATEAVSRHQPVIEQRTGHGNAAGPARSCVVTSRFDAEQTALVFAADWLERPHPGADPVLYQALQERVTGLAATVYGDLPSWVRRIACNLLHCGAASRESAAEVLSMHPRTLDRRLQRLAQV